MKSLILSFLIIGALVTPDISLARGGGDLGGGGTLSGIQKDFKLDAAHIEFLKEQQELTQARQAWLETLTPAEQEQVLNKVFKHLIAPQISGTQLSQPMGTPISTGD
jgi:hypothetical protein